jgi:hypothetical protein
MPSYPLYKALPLFRGHRFCRQTKKKDVAVGNLNYWYAGKRQKIKADGVNFADND